LGLSERRVVHIRTRSPIPPERRPLSLDLKFNMSYHSQERELPKFIEYVRELLDSRLERGIIHAPYTLAKHLAGALAGEARLLFHTRDNKREVLEQFKRTQGAVLLASGMYEGVSLDGDLARWQLIAKVPWPSLAEPAIKYKADTDREWYLNETIRQIVQAYGRVCRGEDDYGETIICDKTFSKLLESGRHLFPSWFLEVLN
jgi:ATP-dependent DNA helicase DinG